MSQTRRIALLMGQDLSFCREVIRGIRAYGIHKKGWAFRNGPADVQIISSLREWKPDGIIAELYSTTFSRKLLRLERPLVDIAYWLPSLKVSVVDVDHQAVGRMAAEYLTSLGLSHFAFFGSGTAGYSMMREAGFREGLAEKGHPLNVCHREYLREAPTTISWKKMESQTRQWLRKLPKPVGLLVCNDVMARSIADICGQLSLHVPDDIALLGVDNDELECLLASPPLSSIAIPAERIGYEAAKKLDEALSKRKPVVERIFSPPVRVVARQSTDIMTIRDPGIVAALRYIQAHAADGINVANLIRNVGIGRRELERKFRARLGRSGLQEICRKKIEQAQKLLVRTDLPMPTIAKLSGFSSAPRLTIVFQRVCGMPPTAYRQKSQIRDELSRG